MSTARIKFETASFNFSIFAERRVIMKTGKSLQTTVHKSVACLKRNSSTILTIVGAVGVVGTAVSAATATPKAMRLLKQAKEEKGEELSKVKTVIVAAPAYIPSFLIGASTITCIFGANVFNKRQQASIASAYALASRSYKEYKTKVKELLGEETDIQIRDAIAKDKCNYKGVYVPGCGSLEEDGKVGTRLFYDEWGERYFESTISAVQNAEYHFNRNLSLRGYANMNEFYEFLGLEETKEGENFGYSIGQLLEKYDTTWVDFDHRPVTVSEDGLECCVISLPVEPTIEYEDY